VSPELFDTAKNIDGNSIQYYYKRSTKADPAGSAEKRPNTKTRLVLRVRKHSENRLFDREMQ
jgi:hypothetical protein